MLPEHASSSYIDESSFQQHWLPVLAVEAAQTAVASQTSVTVHNVAVVWSREGGGEDETIAGELSLSQDFCRERQILLSGDPDAPDDLAPFGLHKSAAVSFDMLCVRYSGLKAPDLPPNVDPRMAAVFGMLEGTFTWVGHCVVVGVARQKGGVRLTVRLQSAGVKMPAELLDPVTAMQLPATLEIIPKTPLYRSVATLCAVIVLTDKYR